MDDRARDLFKRSAELRERADKARESLCDTSRAIDETRERTAEIVGRSRNLARQIVRHAAGKRPAERVARRTLPAAATPHCPACRQSLSFHNSRTEPDATGESVVIDVYLCIKHGFFHMSDGKALAPGM